MPLVIDPQSIFIIGMLLMLANGGILGVVHREILPQLQSSALVWRRGTLLLAGACVFFASINKIPVRLGLLSADALLLAGTTCYWYALRQFFHRRPHWRIHLPALLGIAGVGISIFLLPSYKWRQLAITLALLAIFAGSAITLWPPAQDRGRSRRVLLGMFAVATLFVLLRLLALLYADLPQNGELFAPPQPVNALTPLIIVLLPSIGTTAFLLMCAERLKRRLERAASTDYLTSLPNRRTLAEQGKRGFSTARASGRGYAVAVIDIDYFKRINDAHGHEIGDEALKHVAGLLRRHCRGDELPTRQGGEEFVVLLDNIDAQNALLAGERLRGCVEAHPYRQGGIELPITVSIGIALRDDGDDHFDRLLSRADAALYQAKAGGRNRVMLADTPRHPD